MPVRATLQFRKGYEDKSRKTAIVEILLPKGKVIAHDAKNLPSGVWEALQKSPEGITVEYGDELIGDRTVPVTLAGPEPGVIAEPIETEALKITKVTGDFLRVYYNQPTPKGRLDEDATAFQVTDKALGLIAGSEFRMSESGEYPGNVIQKFSENTTSAPGIAGTKPDINRNPYNFVALAGDKPWLDQANESHPGHDKWLPDLLCGTVKVSLEARTPVFVPAGFPREEDRETLRHFCKLHKAGRERYAIPGSSFKGPLRAMVEAITNDYFGVANEEEYTKKIPYRRRAFQVGRVMELPGGGWSVQPHSVPRGTQPGPGKFLFNRKPAAGLHVGTPVPGGRLLTLAAEVVGEYHSLLDHPHFKRYYEGRVAEKEKVYFEDLEKVGFERIKKDLRLKDEDWIYYTTKTDDGREIDSFGKNVNYLWPALRSVKELAREYFPPDRDLRSPLGLADRMFGFASGHGEGSHPFRGKLRFETLWGPGIDTVSPIELKLAPLTSPATRAKARPLYLKPRTDQGCQGFSASYSDPIRPTLRGRKFYWRQNPGNPEQIWPLHKASTAHAKPQLPPPIAALPAAVEFEGRIHFRNLSREELGALLFAIEGAKIPGWEHTLQLGKGKPRGLGTFAVKSVVVTIEDRERAWKSLNTPMPAMDIAATEREKEQCRLAFAKWGLTHAGKLESPDPLVAFKELEYIQDFIALNRWPEEMSVRYYPLHFSEYSWLPTENQNPDVPKMPHKVKAMRPAGAEYRQWKNTRAE